MAVKNTMTKRRGVLPLLLLPLLIPIIPYNSSADSNVDIQAPSPGLVPNPQQVLIGNSVELRIEETGAAPHSGVEIAVWDGDASPVFGAACPLDPTNAGGKKWQLRAENGGAPNDFETLVTYTIPDTVGNNARIRFPFGGGVVFFPGVGGMVVENGATVSPAAPAGGFAWRDLSLVVANDNIGFGTSSNIYEFASCGTEGAQNLGYLGTAQFFAMSDSTTTTQSNPSGTVDAGFGVTDTATVVSDPSGSGIDTELTGTVLFFLCGPDPNLADPVVEPFGCPIGGTQVGGPIPIVETGANTGVFVATSSPSGASLTNVAGKYCWRAEYSGDSNYFSSSHTNNDFGQGGECFQVGEPPKTKIVKTIHAEKQTFDGFLPQGNIPVIIDVTIIAEIYEDMGTQSIIQRQVVVISCMKQETPPNLLGCESYVPSQDIVPVRNCSEISLQYPPVMNTTPGAASESEGSNMNMNTIVKGQTAKTIEAQKEVFRCIMNTPSDPTDDKKVDLLLFTEIFQDLKNQESEDPQIFSVRCVIKIADATVESCRFKDHPV